MPKTYRCSISRPTGHNSYPAENFRHVETNREVLEGRVMELESHESRSRCLQVLAWSVVHFELLQELYHSFRVELFYWQEWNS